MQRTARAESLRHVASALLSGGAESARALAQEHFPWTASTTSRLTPSRSLALKVFQRDRFIDRYSGSRLVFPGTLLALGSLLPDAFPMSATWKVSESHEIFWELWPVVDHVVPVTRQGGNDLGNLVTTSTVNNSAKGAALVGELNWTLLPEPSPSESWDGMTTWFRSALEAHPGLLSNSALRGWAEALHKNAA